MKEQQQNIIRALFLLLVFSLNTIVGFACSIGIDMGYNSMHHQYNSSNSPSKCHTQKSDQKHAHGNSEKHSHKHQRTDGSTSNTQNDCCANDVTKFIQLDKTIVKTNFNFQAPSYLVVVTRAFIQPLVNETNLANGYRLQFVRRSCSIYNTDIRITIQSFLI
jgi:hypothetical protein